MSDRTRWTDLFRNFRDFEAEREADARARELAARAEEEFEAWCAWATDRAMADLADEARKHAADFEESAGRRIDVEYPSHMPIGLGDQGPFMSFMRISLEGSHIHLYSYRGAGTLPAVHWVQTSEAPPRSKRLVSEPGCYIRRATSGYELCSVADDDTPAAQTSAEDVMFAVFERLIRAVRRRRNEPE